DGLHPLVDLVARAVDVELGLGAHRQPLHLRWVVALVRTTHKALLEAEGADDLGRARDQRDDAHGPNLSGRHTIWTMRFLARLVLAAALGGTMVGAHPSPARAQADDDWGVKRNPFDKRVVDRWKAVVERDPND